MEVKTARRPEIYICAGGLAVMAVLYIRWALTAGPPGAAGYIAAFASAALFTGICLRFVRGWMESWHSLGRSREEPCPVTGERPYTGLKIFLLFLAADIWMIVFVYFLRLAAGYRESFGAALNFWTCTDSQHYLDIARDWYLSEGSVDRVVQLVFLPGYPLAVRAVNYAVGNYLISGLLVSAFSYAGAGVMLYKLIRLDYSRAASARAIKYLAIIPGGFFFAAPMSDSLFLLLSLGCVYFVRKEKWLTACLAGGLAAFTRSLGLLLLVPALFHLISLSTDKNLRGQVSPWKRLGQFAGLLLIPAGFAAYCWINYRVSGDPFKFMEYQREHWGQQMGLFFNTASYQTENVIACFRSGRISDALGLWIPNLLAQLFALLLMLTTAKKLRPDYTAWFIAYFAVAIGATWLLSAPRYLIGLPVIYAGFAELTERRRVDTAAAAGCVILSLMYAWAFIMRWQVW